MTIDIENKLKVKDVNPTAMRLLVLDFLTKQNAAISLNDLERGWHHLTGLRFTEH
ncbi:hypothetical protein [Pedobacter steynii]